MSSTIKCSGCGLMNFATAEICKRCDTNLTEAFAKPAPRIMPDEYHLDVVGERKGFSPLRVLLLILVVGGAIWLYCQYGTEKASTDRAADEKKQQQLLQKHEQERCGPGGVYCR